MIKIGDEVLVRATILYADNNTQVLLGLGKQYNRTWCDKDLVQPYHEQPQPVWRDGAVETAQEGYIWYFHKHDPKNIHYSNYNTICYWEDVYWMPYDEFPMPATPMHEHTIEPCPFCDTVGDDIVSEQVGTMWSVVCGNCGYMSIACFTEAEAIAAHNLIARRKPR